MAIALAKLTRAFTTSLTIALMGGALLLGYQFLRAGAAADIYRDRLIEMTNAYKSLQDTYNQMVEKTAVTELVVKDGKLSVRVVSQGGVLREIPTPFDPSGEIYVDFVVRDGRLWIRRVFDDTTPPSQGVLIDPELSTVAWVDDKDHTADGQALVGKAVYRALGEGRWVVSVTGGGSLGLVRVDGNHAVELAPTPDIHDYAAITTSTDARVESLGVAEVLSQLMGGS